MSEYLVWVKFNAPKVILATSWEDAIERFIRTHQPPENSRICVVAAAWVKERSLGVGL